MRRIDDLLGPHRISGIGLILACMLLFSALARSEDGFNSVRIEFSGLAAVLPWDEAANALHYGRLKLHGPKNRLEPGERWLETLVVLEDSGIDLANTSLRVTLADEATMTRFAEATQPVNGTRALVRVDMRTPGTDSVRIKVQWVDQEGELLGRGEMVLHTSDEDALLPAGTRIPVRIDMPMGAALPEAWPVRFGVPFPAGALWAPEELRLVGSTGLELPSQWEVSGKWAENGSVKWLWVDALPGANQKIFLEAGPRSTASKPTHPVQVTQLGVQYLVDTGVAEYRVGPDGALIKQAALNGRVVAREGHTRGLYVVDQQGRTASATSVGATVALESDGPVSAVLRIEGGYATASGEELARHVTRLRFTAGRPEVAAVHTLILTRDTNDVWFSEIGWELETAIGALPTALFGLSPHDPQAVLSVPLDQVQRAKMVQHQGVSLGLKPRTSLWNRDEPSTSWTPGHHGVDAFQIVDEQSGAVLHAGTTMGDWAALAGRDGGWLVSCRDAAAQHPKGFSMGAHVLTMKLFSPSSGRELDFRLPALMRQWKMAPLERVADREKVPGHLLEQYLDAIALHESNAVGWAKTHELLLSPLDPIVEPGVISRLHSGQVFAHVAPWWIRKSGVIGPVHPRDRERFPEAETVIDGVFWGKVEQGLGGPVGGFVDYHAGPHWIGHSWRTGSYTIRSDAWHLYARSGERTIREFAQGANRAFLDNNIAHWPGPHKTLGLFIRDTGSPGTRQQRNRTRDLPLYWQGSSLDNYELSTSANLDQALLDYHLTGYRRAGDILANFARSASEQLTPETQHWRVILALRHIAQAYSHTWDPKLRELIYSITMRQVYDPGSDVLLTKARPFRSSTYKMATDSDTLLDLCILFNDPLFCAMTMAIGRYSTDKAGILPPVRGQNRATGQTSAFLWEQTKDPLILAGFDHARRRLVAEHLLDPGTREVRLIGVSQVPRLFKGLPIAMDVLTRAGALDHSPASWLSFALENDQAPASVFFIKPGETSYPGHRAPLGDDETAMELIVRKEWSESPEHAAPREEHHALLPGAVGGMVVLKPHTMLRFPWIGHDQHAVTEHSSGATRVRIPKDAPGGLYELVIAQPGVYSVYSNQNAPLALFAAGGWTQPRMNPPVRICFNVPEKKTGQPKIYFANKARLFTPDGGSYLDGESLSGWVDLSLEQPGVWSFESIDPGQIKTRNLPALFAAGDPTMCLAFKEWTHGKGID